VAMRSREAVFDILFASASQTLLELGRDPKRLGGELGVTMVLHTWTRELHFHPHVHAIVTGGGLSDDDARWMRARKNFLFPVRVMGALFRGKMLAALEHAHARGHLDLGDVDLRTVRSKSWIVYAKRPFGGPEQVIRYLGRYTHRVGISNQRLVSMDERGVTFRTKDGNVVTVAGREMLARFVQHVLPPRFVHPRPRGKVEEIVGKLDAEVWGMSCWTANCRFWQRCRKRQRRCCCCCCCCNMREPIPPALAADGESAPADFPPRHTQPTVFAITTTASSDMPIVEQCWAHVAEASLGTLTIPFVPTLAVHAIEHEAITANRRNAFRKFISTEVPRFQSDQRSS